MTLTSYAGTNIPSVQNTRGNVIATATNTWQGILTDANVVSRGDEDGIYIVFKLDSTTATVVTVTSVGLGGTWRRAATAIVTGGCTFEFWECTNYDRGVNGSYSVTVSASVTAAWVATVVNNYGTIVGRSVSTGTGTAATTSTFSIASANMMAQALFWAGGGATLSTNDNGVKQPPNWTLGASPTYSASNWSLISTWSSLPGASSAIPLQRRATLSTSQLWFAVQVSVSACIVDLDDYTYKFGDDGVLLNDPNQKTLPIYDVTKVQGLSDLTFVTDTSSLDGQDGGYANASFLDIKTVVLEGTIYCAPTDTDTLLEAFKRTILPTRVNKPLHWRHPNTGHRTFWAKPIGFTADIDQGRARGTMPFQLQFSVSDPRAYGEGKGVLLPRTGTPTVVTLGGNKETYPKIYFYLATGDTGSTFTMQFSNTSWPTTPMTVNYVQVTPNTTGRVMPKGDWYMFDLAKRTLVNSAGVDYSWAIDVTTKAGWWGLLPGSNQVTFTATGSSTTESAYMTYSEAWS